MSISFKNIKTSYQPLPDTHNISVNTDFYVIHFFFQGMKAYPNSVFSYFHFGACSKVCVHSTQTEAKDEQRKNERLFLWWIKTYEVQTAARVPTGMLCSGLWRSELMLNPAITPTHTQTESYCENKTGDKGPFRT